MLKVLFRQFFSDFYFIGLYFTNYAGVAEYMEEIREKCRQTGSAETYWGRKRTIPEIHDRNKMRIANGERTVLFVKPVAKRPSLFRYLILAISLNKESTKTRSPLLRVVTSLPDKFASKKTFKLDDLIHLGSIKLFSILFISTLS